MIYDSYSCRNDKGLHKGFERLQTFIKKSTKNYSHISYVLKCDIRKFFDSISHNILFELIAKRVHDPDILILIHKILDSFHKTTGIGLPLGNVTSQLFTNIYLDELDQFIKHNLKVKYYIRYCDDFVIIDQDIDKLRNFIIQINKFLNDKLKLTLHPNKISIRKVTQGIDFLGFVSMKNHVLLRTKTKKRIIKKIKKIVLDNDREKLEQCLPSYLGILSHVHGCAIEEKILKIIPPILSKT